METRGTVTVGGVKFAWSLVDGDHPVISVHHAKYGSRSEAQDCAPEIQARLLAKEFLTAMRRKSTPH